MTTKTLTLLTLSLAALLSAGCASAPDGPREPAAAQEVPAASPRLAISYDGGVLVLDARSLELVDDIEAEGFLRLSPAGDGRHVLVADGDRFTALDTGTWSEAHGSHAHHFTAGARRTEVAFGAARPGHVVAHEGLTALFDDGAGTVQVFDPAGLAAGPPQVVEVPGGAPHHGAAVPLADGGLITTLADASGIRELDAQGREIARGGGCPGVHGVTATGEGVVFGCENGVLVHRDGAIAHIAGPDAYGRVGNLAGSPWSSVVLGDYKVQQGAALERPETVMLADMAALSMRPVVLGTSYSFRSLARGPAGEALVLGTDGALHVIDPDSGELVARVPVVAPWTEPDAWQEPRPALFVSGGTAYVTEPSTRSVHAVDLAAGAVAATTELPRTPNEITGVSG